NTSRIAAICDLSLDFSARYAPVYRVEKEKLKSNGIPTATMNEDEQYLRQLCNVDPIRYGLLFERFMDPSRNEMPDIDIDICQEGWQKIIEYVRQKYGHVAQIITFGTLAAKAACKDVGRVLGVPLPVID